MTTGSVAGGRERLALWGFAFLVLFVPLVPFRYLVLPAGTPGAVGVVLSHGPTVVCLLLGAAWLWGSGGALGPSLGRIALGWPVAALLLVGVLSSVGAREPGLSLAKTLYYFATGGLLYLVLVHGIRRERPARVLLYCLLGAAYVAALYGIFEFAVGANPVFGALFDPARESYRRFAPDPWFERRIVSCIGHPVALGSYLALVLPLSLAAAVAAPSRWLRVILAVGTVGLLVALVLTFSRGAWLAAVVAVGVYLALRGRRYLLLLPVVLGLVVVGALSAAGVSELARARVRDAYSSYVLNFASTTRGTAYGYTAVIANRHPFTGLGTGMYRFTAYDLRRELPLPTPLGVLDTPDNGYLMWLAENGALGLVAVAYVLVCLFGVLWAAATAPAPSARREQTRGFIGACAGLCVGMSAVDALYLPVTRTVFWIAAGLAVVLAANKEEEAAGDGDR